MDRLDSMAMPLRAEQHVSGNFRNVARGHPAYGLVQWQHRLELPLTHGVDVHKQIGEEVAAPQVSDVCTEVIQGNLCVRKAVDLAYAVALLGSDAALEDDS